MRRDGQGISTRDVRGGRRLAARWGVTWLALLGMFLQLAVAGACHATSATGPNTPFPICHAHADDGGAPSNHDGPAGTDHCPFCGLHCHALGALAPTPTGLDRVAPVLVRAATPSWTSAVGPRAICPAASPRGPPALI